MRVDAEIQRRGGHKLILHIGNSKVKVDGFVGELTSAIYFKITWFDMRGAEGPRGIVGSEG